MGRIVGSLIRMQAWVPFSDKGPQQLARMISTWFNCTACPRLCFHNLIGDLAMYTKVRKLVTVSNNVQGVDSCICVICECHTTLIGRGRSFPLPRCY